jgi:small GTP-binding protein
MLFKWKISVLGDSSVGKTSLVRHFCEGYFKEDYISTIGVSFLRKEIKLGEHNVTLQIWDLGGQTIFSNIRNNYLKGTHGALILFDLTEKSTLAHVQQWYDEVCSTVGKIPLVIIGNKSDLPFKDKIIEKADAMAKDLNSVFFKASAKTGENMNEIFLKLSQMIYENSLTQSAKMEADAQDAERQQQ